MGRRTWRQIKQSDGTTKMLEVGASAHIPRDDLRFDCNFLSPIDGKEIRNKRELHDHNRRHNVVQTQEGHNEDWSRDARKRDRFFNGNPDGKGARIEAIKRTIDQLSQ